MNRGSAACCALLVGVLLSASNAMARASDERIARAATALVVAALADGASYEVVTEGDLRGVVELEVEKQLAGCDDASCVSDVAGALGARYVVMGQFDRVGTQLILNLSLFDSDQARVVARAGVNASSEEELAARLPPATRRMRDAIVREAATRILVLDARLPKVAPPDDEELPLLRWSGMALVGGGLGTFAVTYLLTAAIYASILPIVLDQHADVYWLHFVPGPGPAVAGALLGASYAQPLAFASSGIQLLSLAATSVGGGLWLYDALAEEE